MDNFKHKKSLGQNFLHDENILNKIVTNLNVSQDDLIIEIGLGQGALTKKLKKLNCFLIGYEIDERTKEFLLPLQDLKTKIIYQDILKAEIKKDITKNAYNKLFVVANLPYYITTPILEKLINEKLEIEEMILMVQKEVANRFAAKPGSKTYGSLSVFLNYYFDVVKLFDVSRNCFNPIPNVDSAVVKFIKNNKKDLVKNEEIFFNLIKDAFKQKRKTIKNNLLNYDIKLIESVLIQNNLNLLSRAEMISIEVFIKISNLLSCQEN